MDLMTQMILSNQYVGDYHHHIVVRQNEPSNAQRCNSEPMYVLQSIINER